MSKTWIAIALLLLEIKTIDSSEIPLQLEIIRV
jgi:hypothetical protein